MENVSLLTIPSAPLPYCLEYGETRYSPGDSHPTRRGLGVYDLIMVKEGVLYIGEEQEQWEVQPGQVVVLHPDRYHYSVRPCDRRTVFYWLHFTTAANALPGQPLQAAAYAIRLPQYWSAPSPYLLYAIFDQLLLLSSVRRSEAFWREQGLFLELLKQLDDSRYRQEGSRRLAVAETVEAYIRQHFHLPVTNAHLSEKLHFHYNYLTRCMKEAYGVTPSEYVLECRLEQAKRLLLKTDWPMPRIAEEVGFEYASYFSRCFMRRNGLSPLQYRKQFSV